MPHAKAHDHIYDVAIIGGGIAGLSVALRLPDHMRVALFTKGQLGESNTRYAQGGLTAALGADDSPELHFQDTIAAGAGLCDEAAVRILVEQAPAAVQWLIQMGVQFDRAQPNSDTLTTNATTETIATSDTSDTSDTNATSATNFSHVTHDGLLLGREAAHSRWRVLHAGGDATGAEIERALVAALQKRPGIVLYEETYVSNLLVQDGACIGVEAIDKSGHAFSITASATVLANGGAGSLWLHTSNPSGATADGLALAWRAGAALTDLEFMQFHPTVLVVNGRSHLISEAVRGEGAYLRNHAGERFMPRYGSRAELEPRDVVARAILSEMLAEGTDCQYLDLRHLPAEKMRARFPTISAICRNYGLDLARDLLPVAPAAHYCMGGVMVDTYGHTTLPGLYAVGEVACTGVHGANRLASNSLLEGLVFGLRLADTLQLDVRATLAVALEPRDHPVAVALEPRDHPVAVALEPRDRPDQIALDSHVRPDPVALEPRERPVPPAGLPVIARVPPTTAEITRELRAIMWQYVSLCRDEEGLLAARGRMHTLKQSLTPTSATEDDASTNLAQLAESTNMLLIAELVINAALQRRESRGSHWRSDYASLDETLAGVHYAYVKASSQPITNTPGQEVLAHA